MMIQMGTFLQILERKFSYEMRQNLTLVIGLVDCNTILATHYNTLKLPTTFFTHIRKKNVGKKFSVT
jgi:hypothetical protein